MLINLTPPKVSLTSRLGALVSASKPQENCPAFQTNLPLVGLQVWSPPLLYELANNPLAMLREPEKELELTPVEVI